MGSCMGKLGHIFTIVSLCQVFNVTNGFTKLLGSKKNVHCNHENSESTLKVAYNRNKSPGVCFDISHKELEGLFFLFSYMHRLSLTFILFRFSSADVQKSIL